MATPFTRRAALFGALALPAAVPAVAFASDVSKWAEDSDAAPTILPPEVMAAINNWKSAIAVKEAAYGQYQKVIEASRVIPDADPTRNAWIDADDEATRAQWKLLKLLREVAS